MRKINRMDKNDLDCEIVSLCKKRDAYKKLLYYYGENHLISELKQNVDQAISRLMKIYPFV